MKPVLVLEGKSTQERLLIYGNEGLNNRASKGTKKLKDLKGIIKLKEIFLQPLPGQEFHLPCVKCKRVRKVTKSGFYYMECLECLKKS